MCHANMNAMRGITACETSVQGAVQHQSHTHRTGEQELQQLVALAIERVQGLYVKHWHLALGLRPKDKCQYYDVASA